MIACVTFDSWATSYEIKNELSYVKSDPAIKDLRLLKRTDGQKPTYCVEITAAEGADEEIRSAVERARSSYSSQISNLSMVTYQEV